MQSLNLLTQFVLVWFVHVLGFEALGLNVILNLRIKTHSFFGFEQARFSWVDFF